MPEAGGESEMSRKNPLERGNVLVALRAKVGPSGHIRRQGKVLHAGVLREHGFLLLTSSCGGYTGLLKAVEKLRYTQ